MGTWSDCMPDTVTVGTADNANADKWGENTYTTTREIACRLEQGNDRQRDADGQTVQVTDIIYTHDAVDESEVIWLPGANTANRDEARHPESVTIVSDLGGGDTLYEVRL